MWERLKRISLTRWILIGMALGVLFGWAFPEAAQSVRPLSTTFLRMIKSIIVPIIFSTLVIGIAGHGDDMKRVGRLALKSILYFELVTTLALFIGLGAVHLIKPGVGVVLSGGNDPVTPDRYAEQIMKGLRNGKHLIAVGQGHGQLATGCIPRLTAEFIGAGTAAGLDDACVRTIRPTPFMLSRTAPAP